jgi:hypothetical protein
MKNMPVICLVLAVLTAVVYFLLQIDVINVPADSAGEGPKWFGFIMAGCYIVGGLLVLLKKRWVWTVGLVINTLIIVAFFIMYFQKPDIMLSLPGLGTKIAQALLEAGLIYLIVTSSRKPQLVRKIDLHKVKRSHT